LDIHGAKPVVDNIAFKAFYNAHAKGLYNFILWMTRDADAGRDVLQTVFIRAWKSDSLPQNFEDRNKWLFTAARNACYDTFRYSARLRSFKERYEGHVRAGSEEVHDSVFWDILSECSETERCILYLHLKAGYSYSEIGAITALSEANVRVKICRAMKTLREKYARSRNNG
jgi:RNA polymerase sigma factor (sigma-70 family)